MKGAQGPASWSAVFVSAVGHPEAVAAIERKHNVGDISRSVADQHIGRIDRDFQGSHRRYAVVDVNRPITNRAARLATTYGLRGYDAVHLASALTVQTSIRAGSPYVFVCADGELLDAADQEGLTVLDP